MNKINLIQFSSVTQSCPTLCSSLDCSTPGLPVHHHSQSLFTLRSIESVMPSNHLILCRSFLLPPSIFPSISVIFKWVSSSHQVAKYWSFSFNISPSNEYSGLIMWVVKIFFVQFCVFLPSLPLLLLGPYHFCLLLCPSLPEMFP